MASIVLGAAGSALGAATGLPFAATLGASLGQMLGSTIDNSVFGSTTSLKPINGPRLASLGVQTSTYGKMIPIVYGVIRIGGNIIWSQPIQETVTTTTSSAGGGGKGGGGSTQVTQTTTSYSYSVTLAIGICEGPLDGVWRVWADAKQLDLSQYTVRIYNGSESQLPDSLIQSIEGAANTPAYRGLAYVVFENFALGDYGNRIPNFTFEVEKKALYPDYNGQILENVITGMVMIPGAGEFVYDTTVEYKVPGVQVGGSWVQQGSQLPINMQTPYGKANALVSLDQLQNTCPNVGWVSVVVTWFGNSMNAGSCIVMPGVEYQVGATTTPDIWHSGGFMRTTARQITLIDGTAQYGGTPDDTCILNYLAELRARGFKIALYPLMFMDVSGKPWRGELTGSATDVAGFFTKTNGYNAFITHYANLVAGKVDAFIIGSEMKGLTGVTDTPGNYPAVNALVSLAASVKSILGGGVTVTYAADWSEYHHAAGGWYNLDPLWASPHIDVIGIDAYFPLTNAPQGAYDIPSTIAGWTSGEDYDWYYSDVGRTVQASLSPAYAIKNIAWFWSNAHVNPDSTTTGWVPESKKIWFTEYGFPSVDGSTNQPNVFYAPGCVDSAFPYFSKGRVDFRAQRTGLMATQAQWQGSSMVERMFVWTWDARPYPYWPDLTSVWADGAAWQTGHWVEGKLGISHLAAIVSDLIVRSGLTAEDIDVSQISDQVEGFVIASQQTIRDSLEILQSAYFFDTVESDNLLKFVPRGGSAIQSIAEDNLVPAQTKKDSSDLFQITRMQEIELPKRVNIVYLNRLQNYQSAAQYSQREVTSSLEISTLDMPIVFADQTAKTIADVTLFSAWMGRNSYQFDVPIQYVCLEPADVITVTVAGVTHTMRITSTYIVTPGIVRMQAMADDVSIYDFYTPPGTSTQLLVENNAVPVTDLTLLDLPAFPGDDADKGAIRLGGIGLSGGWTGAAIYRSDDNGANYGRLIDLASASVIGSAINSLPSGPATVFDIGNTVTVLLLGGELQSVTELGVLNGANAAVLADEIIQFETATLVEPGKYTLSGLLRGRLGTEWAVGTHAAGDAFVLLDGSLTKQVIANNMLGLARLYKPVTYGGTLSAAIAQSFTYTGVALKPYSPVHIAGARDGSANLTISWVRRTRLGGDWQDNIDVPLNEAAEAYEVDIMNGSTVVRTIGGLGAPIAGYSAAQQVADFGSAQPSVAINIYQISAIIGRGYPGGATV